MVRAGLATEGFWVRSLLAALSFGTLAIPFTQLCQCVLEETPKAVGSFYLVSTPGEVKYPHTGQGGGGKCVICRGFRSSEIYQSCTLAVEQICCTMSCLEYYIEDISYKKDNMHTCQLIVTIGLE